MKLIIKFDIDVDVIEVPQSIIDRKYSLQCNFGSGKTTKHCAATRKKAIILQINAASLLEDTPSILFLSRDYHQMRLLKFSVPL